MISQHANKFGIDTPACKNCCFGRHETDGDYGTIDCGWYCSISEKEIDQDGICDVWTPEFWMTSFSNEVGGKTQEQVLESVKRAMEKYENTIDQCK